jgi:hypothetical protein
MICNRTVRGPAPSLKFIIATRIPTYGCSMENVPNGLFFWTHRLSARAQAGSELTRKINKALINKALQVRTSAIAYLRRSFGTVAVLPFVGATSTEIAFSTPLRASVKCTRCPTGVRPTLFLNCVALRIGLPSTAITISPF